MSVVSVEGTAWSVSHFGQGVLVESHQGEVVGTALVLPSRRFQ